MRFSELIERIRERGVVVAELRAGSDPEIRGVSEDSRKVRPGDLFVARPGSKTSGANYVDDAAMRGAAAIVVQEDAGLSCAVAYARVADVNLACALLAHEVAGNPTAGMKMIGITGTKGKTTVAYLLRSVLKAAGHKVGMIGTVEIDDGNTTTPADMTTPGAVELVALFSQMKANGVTHCVMEVSSHALHQRRVAGIDFAVAIFTNLTGDHLDYHKTMEEYAAAKAILFEGLKKRASAVVNIDDPWAKRLLRDCKAHVVPFRIGAEPPRDGWSAEIMAEMDSNGMRLGIRSRFGSKASAKPSRGRFTKTIGVHNAANQLAALAALFELGERKVPSLVFSVDGAPGRLQHVEAKDGVIPFTVFVDYAHTHDALENVLTALRATMGAGLKGPSAQEPPKGGTPNGGAPNLICLFGCGGDRDRTKRPKMGAIAERLADVVIVTSDNPRTENPAAIIEEICAGFAQGWQCGTALPGGEPKITIEPDRRTAIRKAIALARPGDVVLLAGKGHENYQIIGTTKHHFDDVEEAEAALREVLKTSTI